MNYFNKIVLFLGLMLIGEIYASQKINVPALKQELKFRIDKFEQHRNFLLYNFQAIKNSENANLTLERVENGLFLLKLRYQNLCNLNTSVDFLALADHLEALPRKDDKLV